MKSQPSVIALAYLDSAMVSIKKIVLWIDTAIVTPRPSHRAN